jgi:hypothetical protein
MEVILNLPSDFAMNNAKPYVRPSRFFDRMEKKYFEGELKIDGRPDLCILVTVEPSGLGSHICQGNVFKDGGYVYFRGEGRLPEHAISDAKRLVRNILGITGVIHG